MGGARGAVRVWGMPAIGPVAMRRLLDLSAYCLAFATFARLADTEILLHALWVTVGVGAFLYGLRIALLRILIAAVVAIGYSAVGQAVGYPLILEPLDFAEWPLMILISAIVAVLADRISTSAQRYAALYRQASDRLLTAHEEERGRLARDLHDGVGQTLTAVVLTLDAAEAELWAGPGAPSTLAQGTMRRAQLLAATALEEARDVAAQLRPTRIHEMGLGAALSNLAKSAGVAVAVRFDPTKLPPGLLEREREIDAYRIVQEAIGNAARHSHASNIWIDGDVIDGRMRLIVGDDGVGLEQAAWGRGLGLAGMQERTAILRGRLDVHSRPGEGTVVQLQVPLSGDLDAGHLTVTPVPATDPAG
jgi:two-component system, NarL family, sensor histidine kinase UhpB